MYCLLCGKLRLAVLCQQCLQEMWHVDSRRILANGIKVFSSFAFSELQSLLLSKNNVIGSRIFGRLGRYGVSLFFKHYPNLAALGRENIAVVSLRNRDFGAYSHGAILAQCFRRYGFKVFHNALIIGNTSRFAYLSRKEREEIGRNLEFSMRQSVAGIIIVDDIITTGRTLLEASAIIMQNNHIPLFAWTLCDSRY